MTILLGRIIHKDSMFLNSETRGRIIRKKIRCEKTKNKRTNKLNAGGIKRNYLQDDKKSRG